jgi:hypothetical protein
MTEENVSPWKRWSSGKRWVGESMCPWRENEVGKRMWLKDEDGLGDNFPWKRWAMKKMGLG